MTARDGSNEVDGRSALAIATVGQSLLFQSPSAWKVLGELGLRVAFAASPDRWSTDLQESGDFQAIRVTRDLRPHNVIGGLLDVRRLMARHWALVQVQSPVMGALARVVPRYSPLIYVAHGFHFHTDGSRASNWASSAVERMLAGRCNGIGVVCAEDFARAKHLGFHRRTSLWRLPGAGVDFERFRIAPRRNEQPTRLLYIGELNENKDPRRFIDVLDRLRSQGSDVVGTIIGDGPLRSVVSEAAGVEGASLTWIAHTDEPERFIRESDMLLMPSRREGLPRVVIESLASGRPVVARSNRGTRELLISAAQGRLMTAESTVENWAKAVVAVKAGADDVVRLRESVRRYSADAFMTSYRRFVEHVLARPNARGAFDLNAQGRSRIDAV